MIVAAGVSSSPFPLALPACNLLPTLPSTLTYPALPLTLLPLMSTISMSMSTSSIYGRNPSYSPSTFPDGKYPLSKTDAVFIKTSWTDTCSQWRDKTTGQNTVLVMSWVFWGDTLRRATTAAFNFVRQIN